MTRLDSFFYDHKQWVEILDQINESQNEKPMTGKIIFSQTELNVKILNAGNETILRLDDIISISSTFLEKNNDLNPKNVMEITQSLEKLEKQIRALVDLHHLRNSEVFYDICDFYDQTSALKEKVEETPEKRTKKQILDIINSGTINQEKIEQVRKLVKDNKELLFNIVSSGDNFFDLVVNKCSRSDLFPLIGDVLIEMDKLKDNQIKSIKSFIFQRGNSSKTFFESMMEMEGDESNVIFDAILKVTTDEELDNDRLRKLQVIKYAFSNKRYGYVFLKMNDLSKEEIEKANTFYLSSNKNFSYDQRKYGQWLVERCNSSSTLSTKNQQSLNRWWKAEQMRMELVKSDKGQKDKQFKWESIQRMHYELCNGEEGIPNPGQTRKTSVYTSGGWRHVYCPETQLIENRKEFMNWFNNGLKECEEKKLNPIIFAAQTYQRFVSYHPFENGNGRMGRLLMDYILERFDIVPPVLGGSVLDAIFPLEPANKNHGDFLKKIINGIEYSRKMILRT